MAFTKRHRLAALPPQHAPSPASWQTRRSSWLSAQSRWWRGPAAGSCAEGACPSPRCQRQQQQVGGQPPSWQLCQQATSPSPPQPLGPTHQQHANRLQGGWQEACAALQCGLAGWCGGRWVGGLGGGDSCGGSSLWGCWRLRHHWTPACGSIARGHAVSCADGLALEQAAAGRRRQRRAAVRQGQLGRRLPRVPAAAEVARQGACQLGGCG